MRINLLSQPSWLVGLLMVLVLTAVPAAAQQRFRLAVPGDPTATSSAVLSERELLVTDATGTTFRYVREPRFDTADGRFLGFYNAAAQQPLRWPALGQGAMQLGDPLGQQWRASQQQIQAVAAGGGPLIQPRPGVPLGPGVNTTPAPAGGLGLLQPHGLPNAFGGGPRHIATGANRRGAAWLATIDETGVIRVYDGTPEGWRYSFDMTAPGLIPGAPLGLSPDITPGQPRVFTVASTGALLQVTRGQAPQPIANAQFSPAAALTLAAVDPVRDAFAIDMAGQLWHLNLATQAHRPIPSDRPLVPGASMQVLSQLDRSGGVSHVLFLTDARGSIVQWQSALGGWATPMELAVGFVPGAPLGAAFLDLPNGNRLLYLAAVDWRGQLQLVSGSLPALQATTIDQGTLPPGAPVLVHTTIEGPLLSAIGVDGVWRVWKPGINGAWDVTALQGGFPPGAPVIVDPLTGGLIAVDVRGRIVPAHWHQGGWSYSLNHHTLPLPPRLISRRIVPQASLAPARVALLNGSDEEIVIQVADAVAPANSQEVSIPAGGAIPYLFERDAGAMIEEVYLVPDPVGGGWTEQTQAYPLPPQPRYALSVWANRTTYQYINKNPNKPQGALPNFDLKSHVSLGVLDLPPGELLRDGAQIDLHREALRNRNPGAAGHFGLPSGGPTVVPRP